MKKTAVVLTGASGLLGRAIYNLFKEDEQLAIEGLAFQRATPDLVKLNLLEQTAVENHIRKKAPAVIIHAAAERRPDISRENPELTRALNVTATRQLVKLAQETGAWFVYISTDYVFDGTNPPYRPDSPTHPLNLYGETKYEGEQLVRDTLDSYLILRIPILYGEVEYLGESAVTDLADTLLKTRKQAYAAEPAFDNWAIRYPTYTGDVAVVLKDLIELKQRRPELSGTFHWSGNKAMTKYEMACELAELLQLDAAEIRPVNAPSPGSEPRPRDARLDISATEALVAGRQSDFTEKMRSILAKAR